MHPPSSASIVRSRTRTILVLGASYGGARTAQILAQGLRRRRAAVPADADKWRVLLVDRNSHANHLYIFPRVAVLPGHEHKAFIPYSNVFGTPTDDDPAAPPDPEDSFTFVHARIEHISLAVPSPSLPSSPSSSSSTLTDDVDGGGTVRIRRTLANEKAKETEPEDIQFDFLVYAMGSHLPAPIDLWGEKVYKGDARPDTQSLPTSSTSDQTGKGKTPDAREYRGTKEEAMTRMRADQDRFAGIRSVLVVGGGALGIQFATDIKGVHPTTRVILLHSRHQLLPRFDPTMSSEIFSALEELGVECVLGERLDLGSLDPETAKRNARGETVYRTASGREIAADMILLCTGQRPNTSLLSAAAPLAVDPDTGLARVARTMQLRGIPPPSVPTSVETTPLNSRRHSTHSAGSTATHWSTGSNPSAQAEPEVKDAEEAEDDVDEMLPSEAESSVPATPSRLPPAAAFRLPSACRLASEDACLSESHAEQASAAEDDPELDGYCALATDEGVDADRVEEALERVANLELEDGEGIDVAPETDEEQAFAARDYALETVDDEEAVMVEEDEGEELQPDDIFPRVFAIGDAADAFGAIPAGHNAYYQGEVAARNVLRMIERSERELGVCSGAENPDEDEDDGLSLEAYTPGPPAIKVTLGITKSVYQINGVVGTKDDGEEDLNARSVWAYFGMRDVELESMYE